MVCANCGYELGHQAGACSGCGVKVRESASLERPNDRQELSSNCCPKCHLNDKTEKVAVIVKSQTRSCAQIEGLTDIYLAGPGKELAYFLPRSVLPMELTDLARRLFPPKMTETKKLSAWLTILGAVCLCAGGLALTSTVLAAVGIRAGSEVTSGIVSLAAFLLGKIVFSARDNFYEKEKKTAVLEIIRWNRALAVWSRLYYCHRDDLVFDGDGTKVYGRPEQIAELSYRAM